MPRERPPAVTVLAVLHFVFGVLASSCGICGGVSHLISWPHFEAWMEGKDQPDPEAVAEQEREEQFLRERLPYGKAFEHACIPFDIGLPLLALVAGVGLLRLQPWGRRLSLTCAVLMLLQAVAYGVYLFGFYMPVMSELISADQTLPKGTDRMAYFMLLGFAIPLLVVYLAFCLATLIVLTRPAVVAAFRTR